MSAGETWSDNDDGEVASNNVMGGKVDKPASSERVLHRRGRSVDQGSDGEEKGRERARERGKSRDKSKQKRAKSKKMAKSKKKKKSTFLLHY